MLRLDNIYEAALRVFLKTIKKAVAGGWHAACGWLSRTTRALPHPSDSPEFTEIFLEAGQYTQHLK